MSIIGGIPVSSDKSVACESGEFGAEGGSEDERGVMVCESSGS